MKIKSAIFFICLLLPTLVFAQAKHAPEEMRWNSVGFSIGGRDVIFIGGSMHYFRVPEAEWEPEFRRMHEDGFNIIDTVIPWNLHEPEEGKVDFSALQRFFDLARKYDLYIVARPGPYICAEYDQGGFPRWLSGKEVGFRTDSAESRKWTKHWFDEIMPFLARNQVSQGGPVIMVQLENEYGHPQYISEDEKKEHMRFLWKTASAYGFEIPMMGNDIQFAEDMNDPILSKIYGTVDAYFGSYKSLDKMLDRQHDLNPSMPVGSAEYSLADPEATIRTMLGLGTAYMDAYMFRGGSQFDHPSIGYETANYNVFGVSEEGGTTTAKYRSLKTVAYFLRQFGPTIAQAAPAPTSPTADDPELWLHQRNKGVQGFLFVRSDAEYVSDQTLHLKSFSQQHITYTDPKSGKPRTFPQYSTLLLRPEESRLIPLNLPVGEHASMLYTTADLFGHYDYPQRKWLVFYGNPGDQAETALSFPEKPAGLTPDAIWNDDAKEAVYRFQFGERDQAISLTNDISLLILSRERAFRAKEFKVGGQTSLMISGADEVDPKVSGNVAELELQMRQPAGQVTILSASGIASAKAEGSSFKLTDVAGAQQFDTNLTAPLVSILPGKIQAMNPWTGIAPTVTRTQRELVSLPKLGIWKKGITHYQASFHGRGIPIALQFFTRDYKAVYVNGKFVAEASNRATAAVLGSKYCAEKASCDVDVFYVDTARPKEDLGLWRMDEDKGMRSAEWLDGNTHTPIGTEWKIDFSGIDKVSPVTAGSKGMKELKVYEYSFPRPSIAGADAIWRIFPPEVPGLVYVNGQYMEHHELGEHPSAHANRAGIYLPPSLLKNNDNRVLFVALAPPPEAGMPAPVIRADLDSVRKLSTLVVEFKAQNISTKAVQ